MKRLDRQLDIIRSVDMQTPIHVIGAGGIGSWTVLMLAKMGCDFITVYDNDDVENHNVASQFFKEDQLGMKKVEALRDSVLEQTGIEIEAIDNIEEEEAISTGIVILALDSMKERIRLGKIYEEKNLSIIDGRMGGLSLEIYKRKSAEYLGCTIDPEKIDPTPCTAKAISFNVSVIAGLIVNLVRQELTMEEKWYGDLMFCFNSLSFIKRDFESGAEEAPF